MQFFQIMFVFLISSYLGNELKSKRSVPTANNIIFTSVDGGQTWKDVSAGLPGDIYPLCVYIEGEEVLLSYEKIGLYKANNSNKSLKWERDIFSPGTIHRFFAGNAGTYAIVGGKGIYQKMMLTGVWRPVFSNLRMEFPIVILENPDGSIIVGAEKGMFKSADRGLTWKKVVTDVMVTTLIAKEGILIGGGSKGIMRSADNGDHWDYVHSREGFVEVKGLVDGKIVAVTNEDNTTNPSILKPAGLTNRLRISSDNGMTWYNTDQKLLPQEFISDLYQSGQYYFTSNEKGIYRSSDKGKSWQFVLPVKKDMLFNLSRSGKILYAIQHYSRC